MIETLEKIYTVQEYLDFDEKSVIPNEFVNGKIIPMAGESRIANKLANTLLLALITVTNNKALEIFTHAVRLQVEAGKRYRYPDLMISPVADDEFTHMITQPVLIAEVLSKSTANADLNEKVIEYCQIESLQYYLIIHQDEKIIQMYSRFENKWLFEIFDINNKKIDLSKLNTIMNLDDIYKNIL